MIGRMIGRYRIVAPLGQGGMATVWRAEDQLLGRTVALKVLAESLAASPESQRRFRREAEVAALLDHPGIAPVYDSGEADGHAFIAMALIAGETLAERIVRAPIPLPEVLRIVAIAAGALGYAHARGVIHRDVTSGNIMLADDGRVFVLDFGLALAEGISRVTTSGTMVGTACYLAPEVLMGRPADPRSDLYGLGIVFYEALTGVVPFAGERREALLYAAVHQALHPPSALRPQIGPAIDAIVMRALARDPAARYTDTDALMIDLREASKGLAVEIPAEPDPPSRGAALAEAVLAGRAPICLAIPPLEIASTDGGTPPGATAATVGSALTEALSARLAHLGRLHVVAGDRAASAADLAGAIQMGANLVLRGVLRVQGSRLRVTYALLEPRSGVQLAGDTIEGTALDVFDLEDRLVTSIGQALEREAAGRTPSHPRDPAAADRLAQAMAHLQRYDNEVSIDGAIGILERLLDSEGESAKVLALLARAYLLKYDLTRQHVWENRAASTCERAVRLNGEAPETMLACADLHANAGRTAEARAEYERARAARPDLVDPWLGLARLAESEGHFAEAEEACRRAIALRPRDWRGYNLLGLAYYHHGKYAMAIEPWRRALRLTPDNERAARNLGSALYHMDRYEEALAAFHRSLEIQPNANAYTNLGTVLFMMGRYDESAQALEKAVALTPADAVMWGQLGNACRWVPGRGAQAKSALQRAIDLMRERLERSSLDADAWSRLAGWYAGLGRREEALDAVSRALAIAPDNVQCIAAAGETYCTLGDRAQALRWLRDAVHRGYGVEALRRTPDLAPLRGDPEFEEILNDVPTLVGGDATHRVERGGNP